jgi:hypothetical protein
MFSFCLLNKAKKPLGTFLDAKTNKMLKSTTNFICKDTGATLYPNQLGYFERKTIKLKIQSSILFLKEHALN